MARILVLDDDPRFRTLVRCSLAERGHEVFEVTRTDRAREVLRERTFDLLVVDGLLPDGSGVDLIIWARSRGHAGPILFVSQFWRDLGTFRRLTEEWAVSRVLSKPLTAAQIVVEVETILDRVVAPAPPVAETSPAQEPGTVFEQELAELRRSYAEQFPDALADLRTHLEAARRRPDKDRLAEAHRAVHTLAGSAGSFGFRGSGELLREMELRLEELVEAEAAVEVDGEALAPLVASLERVAQRFRAERGELALVSDELAEREPGTPGPLHRLARVIVVDDDPHVLSQLEVIGRQHMIEVLGARNGDEAVALASGDLDGAVIDVYLRDGEDGYQVARRLRSETGQPDLPLAFFSRDASLGSRVRAAHAGASLFLDKSESEQAFPSAVRHLAAVRQDVKPRVLILSDEIAAADSLATALDARGIDVSVTTDATTLLEQMNSLHPSLLLVKAAMRRVSGFDVCKMVRTTSEWQDLPVLLLTHQDDRSVRRACFEAGADDYVSLPADLEELYARMQLLLERMRLHRERADRDALTGLLMRRPFLEAFKSRLAEAQREEKQLALCVIDLDHFKQLNDGHGHASGDRVLAAFGNLLAARFRVSDIRARWGGEEFAVVLHGEGTAIAQRILDRVLEEFREMTFEGDDGRRFHASFSAGIAAYPGDGSTFQRLFRAADAELYRAKEAGRSRIERTGDPEDTAASAA